MRNRSLADGRLASRLRLLGITVLALAKSIMAAEKTALDGEGRALLRRLNRQEYEFALQDLLGIPWAQIANRLPEDGEAYRFNKSGEALDISFQHMERFMESANY